MASSNAFAINIEGLDQLDAMLKNIGPAVYKKSTRQAVGYAMRPVATAAKRNVQSISQTVAKSIGSKTKLYPKNQTAVAIVGPAKKFKITGKDGKVKRAFTEGGATTKSAGHKVHNPAYTAHLIEFGTKPHIITSDKPMGVDGRFGKRVDHPGTAPHPFMVPALKNNQQQVISRFAAKAVSAIIKYGKEEFNKAGKLKV